MKLKTALCAATALSAVVAQGVSAETITIATVNNGDMIRMQGLTSTSPRRPAMTWNG